jgi:penicillin G amidase
MRALRYVVIAVLLAPIGAGFAGFFALRASLPQLQGEVVTEGVGAEASIERDEQGTPTVRARTRRDLAFATGFAHAQDRYFQMDLMRRAASGELAELLGPAAAEADKRLRAHGFRRVASQVMEQATERERELLDAYAAGVNFALEHAAARPWEYLVLRSQPAPWRAEDSVLVAFSMYLDLNDSTGKEALARAQLREALPPVVFDFMYPLGTEWDAPVTGGTWRAAQIPPADVFNLRTGAARVAALTVPRSKWPLEERPLVGSNSWAVAGTHAAQGAALLANDMHLGLRLPHVWYRARLIVESQSEARDLVGVTLPGLPMLVAGSNGKVAWGYTNSYGDWTDLVIVESDPQDASRYLVPEGSEAFERRTETIKVRGAEPQQLDVQSTRWGPVVRHDAAGQPMALAWTAHHAHATNMRMLDFETATGIEQLLDAANHAGGPVQNVVAADAAGRIGWSLMGQVPVRVGYDSTLPASWRAAGTGWAGWRAPEEYPRIIDPPAGRLWTANARVLDAETWLGFLGDGGYDLGARAAQIRDGLLALPSASAGDMLAIQLDDRALFLARWRDLLLDLIDAQALNDNPARADARRLISNWSGHAAAGDVGYRLVRTIRLQVRKDVFESLTAMARARFPDAHFVPGAQFEGPLWQLVTQRPQHLLDPRYDTWRAALLASVDAVLGQLDEECGNGHEALESCTWGAQNMLSMRHPLSPALPFASRWLDMPAHPMPGDSAMPRVQGRTFGASQRLVVSPGRESEGYLQMPGGPVDHPLSPFYGAGHEAWVHGEPTPLLPGKTQHILRLRPAA